MISQKAKYALKALVALAKADREAPIPIKDIAERENIPQSFLEHILLEMKRLGVVASRRGKVGGYVLARDPSEIGLGQILRAVDGPIAPLPCLSRTAYRRCADCTDEHNCSVRRVFSELYASSVEILDRTTLADAIADPQHAVLEAAGA